MRILRFEQGGVARYGRLANDGEVEVWSDAPWFGGGPQSEHVPLGTVRLVAPVTPSKIVCVGRNYAAHAKELGNAVPDEPLLFLKPPSALLGPLEPILLPSASQRVEHEAEIGVVMGQRLRRATPEEALAAVGGITCVNDVTARDIQRKEVQFTRAKGFDTFCPVGPWIETELDLSTLWVRGRVDGQERQYGQVGQMIFGIGALLSFISRVMTLEPGDLVSTGTPEGVGPLVAGNTVEIEVSGVGTLQNPVL
ncbi:MAG TPA: fumarylacetoacetate hydrolase family protein [Polyangiales bacterium]|nr:fumarylacetoacetate hydrolase family protein [Polyangiales bacterium]